MARIKIEDLPMDMEISKELQRRIVGGASSVASSALPGGDQIVQNMQVNMELLAFQGAVQMESRKFQTLSNASKARHDIAMASVRNIRA